MAPQKRKSGYKGDDFVVDDEDEHTVSSTHTAKRSKTSFRSAADVNHDDEGNEYWEISKARRATISDFKGKKMVSIREYYEKDGKWLPGKKGISMTVEQYNAFVDVMPQIEKSLQRAGVAEVSRPRYDGDGNGGTHKGEEDADEEESEDQVGSRGKANHEATSDEDDD